MTDSQKNSRHPRTALVLGVVLIVLGVFNLAGNVFPGDVWFRIGQVIRALWGVVWPSAFVVACTWCGLPGVENWPVLPRQGQEGRSAAAWRTVVFWEYAEA